MWDFWPRTRVRSLLHSLTRHTVKRVGSCGTLSPSDAVPGAAGAPLPEQAPETALKETLVQLRWLVQNKIHMWEKFYMEFFSANLPKSFTFYINSLSCLSEEGFKCVFCVSLCFLSALQPWQLWKWKVIKDSWTLLPIAGLFSFYVVDGRNWVDTGANNSSLFCFSKHLPQLPACSYKPHILHRAAELSWCQESEGLVRQCLNLCIPSFCNYRLVIWFSFFSARSEMLVS